MHAMAKSSSDRLPRQSTLTGLAACLFTGGVAPNQNPTNNRSMGDLYATLSNAMGAPATTSYGTIASRGVITELLA